MRETLHGIEAVFQQANTLEAGLDILHRALGPGFSASTVREVLGRVLVRADVRKSKTGRQRR